MAVAYLVLRYVRTPPSAMRAVAVTGAWIGAVLALGVQSKASAYLVCATFLVWLAVAALMRDGLKRSAVLAGCLVVATLALSAGIYARNASVLGANVIASDAPGVGHVLVRDRHPEVLATTALKNVSMLAALPSTGANQVLEGAVRGAVSVYGGDIEGTATKEPTAPVYRLNASVPFSHDSAPAPASLVLLALAAVVGVSIGENRDRSMIGFTACVLASMLLLAALVTWNEYVTRVLLPPLLIGLAVVGPATDVAPRHRVAKVLAGVAVSVTVVWGMVALLFGWTNPLLPGSLLPLPASSPILVRDLGWWDTSYHDLGFRMNIPDTQYAYERIAQAVREDGIDRLAISVPRGRPLYPLLAMIPDTKVQYVGDTLFPQQIPSGDFEPDAVLEYSRIASGTPTSDGGGSVLEWQQVSPKSFIVLRRP